MIGAVAALFALIIGGSLSLGGAIIPLMILFYFLGHTIGPKVLFEFAKPEYKIYLVSGPIGLIFIKLVIKVFAADGKIKANDFKRLKSYLIKEFGVEFGTATELYVKSISKIAESTYSLCKPMLKMKLSHRLTILQQLFEMAVTNGRCSKERELELKKVAKFLHIGKKRFDLIRSTIITEDKTKETSDNQHNKRKHTGSGYKYFEQFLGPMYNPYFILGIDNAASNEQIKKTYRDLVKQFHPDLSMQKSEHYRKKVMEKLQEINEAYETIKKLRGIK